MDEIPENRLTLVFPNLPYFAITRERAALVIVDMQKADAHPKYGIGAKADSVGAGDVFRYYWGAVERAVAAQVRLVGAAHAAGVQVIFTRIATQTRNARDVGNQHRYVNLAIPKGSTDAELLDDLVPGPDDVIFSKTSSSPFNSTSLHVFLNNLGIDTLLVCGVVTNGCVEGTVRDASDLGYDVIMIPDASAAVTPELHQAAITNLDNAFCNCRNTETVLRELAALTPAQKETAHAVV